MLSLERLLACAKGGGYGVLQHRTIEQCLGQLSDRLLAASTEALVILKRVAH